MANKKGLASNNEAKPFFKKLDTIYADFGFKPLKIWTLAKPQE